MAFSEVYDSTELHRLLSVVEKVRALQERGDNIKFPDIVVCGVQSAGKSSVLQGLAGVNLPRSKTITTRIALQLNLACDPALDEGQSYAIIGKYPNLDSSGEIINGDDFDRLGEKIEMLTEELAGAGQDVSSEGTIYLRVVRRHGPTMTLVDLPGISHKDARMKEVTEECFRKRFADPENRHIVLLVLTAATDVESQGSMTAAMEVDVSGERTMIVLTNMDRPFDESGGFQTIEKLKKRAKLGVFPVYNPDDDIITPEQARGREADFFESNGQKFGLVDGQWGLDTLGVSIMEAQAPIVKAALSGISDDIAIRIFKKEKELEEIRANLPEGSHTERKRTVVKILHCLQDEFRLRAEAGVVERNARLNVARRTQDLYQAFKENVLQIAPEWLSDEYKATVVDSIQEHGGGDINRQGTNAEITLFREAYKGKLERECEGLVGRIRQCVRNILVGILEIDPQVTDRPALLPYLSRLIDECLRERQTKAQMIVRYLSRAELTKRDTQDDTRDRIIRKVEFEAITLSAQHAKATSGGGSIKLPPEQVMTTSPADDDMAGIPPEFIANYHDRALEQYKKGTDKEVARIQVSLFAYSKIMTRRMNDVVPMQAHLLLVTSMYDYKDSSYGTESLLAHELQPLVEELSAEELSVYMTVDPELERKAKNLAADIERLKTIADIIR